MSEVAIHGTQAVSVAFPAPSLTSRPLHARLIAASANAVAEALGADDVRELTEYAWEARRICTGAPERESAPILARLLSHYHQTDLPEGLADARMNDWMGDISHIPADVLECACASWRRSRNKFAPSPGQLLALAEPLLAHRVAFRERAVKTLSALEARLAQVG